MKNKENSTIGQSEIIAALVASASIALLLIVSSVAQEYIKEYIMEISLILAIIIIVVLIYMLFSFLKRISITFNNRFEDIKDVLTTVQTEIQGGTSKVMTWNKFWSYIMILEDKIRNNDDFEAEIIVSIGRSGSLVGSLLAGNLGGIPHIAIDRVSKFEGPGGKRQITIIPALVGLKEEISDKNILCVMSECDSGKTLIEAKEALAKVDGVKIEKVKTAVIFRDVKSEYSPDFIAEIDTLGSRRDFPFRTEKWPRTSRMPFKMEHS